MIGCIAGSHFASMSSDRGSMPAASARSITLPDSAMNSAFSGSSLLRSCASVSRANASSRGSSSVEIFMRGIEDTFY